MEKDKETTLEALSKSDDGQIAPRPQTVKTPEETKEWNAQYWTKLGLIFIGVLITVYGGYVATRVLLEYSAIVTANPKEMIGFPSGVALMVIPIIISGLALVLSAAKLLSSPEDKDKETTSDKWISALSPVLRAINIYLASKKV
ncbi:hypothetical protein ACLF2M_003392 [Vibrio vulnificus]